MKNRSLERQNAHFSCAADSPASACLALLPASVPSRLTRRAHSRSNSMNTLTHRRLPGWLFALAVFTPGAALGLNPTATANAPDVTAAGATSYSFVVQYSDDGNVNNGTLDNRDVRVTGPGGFSVAAQYVTGSAPVSAPYIEATYTIVPPGGSWDPSDNGTYAVVMQSRQVFDFINNPVRAGTIGTFTVSVSDSPPPRSAQPLNISTRLHVQTGENVMIAGFIVNGDGAKKVIVRALAPSLQQAGVSNVLADPVVELRSADGTLIARNDDWRQTQQAEISASGLAPQNDLEAALIATLNAGSHTAVVSGNNGSTGVALVEVYDLDGAAAARLVNLSTRGVVETGNNVLIGGFILGNSDASARVVLRAIGPSLTQAGISGAMPDPTLELRDSNGQVVRTNNNWKDSQQAEIQATGIAPHNELESALVAQLPPGPYTAIVAGNAGATGIGLVELYVLRN